MYVRFSHNFFPSFSLFSLQIGDCYVACAGVPNSAAGHAEQAVLFAAEALAVVNQVAEEWDIALNVRIGVGSGSVIAGGR